MPLTNSFERIRRVVMKIPRGRVMTYGDVARAAGMPGAARTVGYAMRALGRDVPWQRVLSRKNARTAQITIQNARGKAEQRRLLEKEGVKFDANGAISLTDFGWPKPKLARSASHQDLNRPWEKRSRSTIEKGFETNSARPSARRTSGHESRQGPGQGAEKNKTQIRPVSGRAAARPETRPIRKSR